MKTLPVKNMILPLKATIRTLFLIAIAVNILSTQPVLANRTVDPVQYNTPFAGMPDPRDAVIYQVNIRCFSATRNFQGIIARLDSIKALGVNVIYLMPIYPVGTLKSVNSPYCVKDYLAVNTDFGTLTDLRMLIDGAHSRGMAVLLDWVGNHAAWDNAWISNKSWYNQDASGNILSPSGWTDVAQLNFQNQDMRQAMISAMKYWVYTANCDGFRCDYADGPPADFWKQAIDTLRNIQTHKLLMFAEGTRSNHFSSGFDYIFGMRLYSQLKTIYSSNASVTNINAINNSDYVGASATNGVVRYTTNHDVNSSDGTPLDLFGGSTGSMAAFIVAAYMKGVPMIYNGQEVGNPLRLTFPFLTSSINWKLNPSSVAEYKKIIAFRNSSEAIRRGNLVTYSNADICAFTKSSAAETVFVLSNLRNSTITYTLPPSIANTQWMDAFTGENIQFSAQISMFPYQYKVFRINQNTPVTGITVRFKKPATWTKVSLYTWSPEVLGGWPGASLTETNGWYNYTFDTTFTGANLIFNNGGAGEQTVDYTISTSTCLEASSTMSGGKYPVSVAACTTGVEDINLPAPVLYPNPVKNKLCFSGSENIAKITVYSLTGEVVLTASSFSDNPSVDASTLKPGVYFVSIGYSNGKQHIAKFVKL